MRGEGQSWTPAHTTALLRDIDEAAAFRHPQRAMRVTLDCAHLRLMTRLATVMGIGAFTSCSVCPTGSDGYAPTRTVVNVEETGVLHKSYRPTVDATPPNPTPRCGSHDVSSGVPAGRAADPMTPGQNTAAVIAFGGCEACQLTESAAVRQENG